MAANFKMVGTPVYCGDLGFYLKIKDFFTTNIFFIYNLI